MGVPINPDRPIEQKLEQKRLEHEKQREAQKKAFEEQMKQLELQQQLEEQALLAASGGAGGKSSGPVRSRSGNDLASFNNANGNAAAGEAVVPSSASKYASAKSMPGSRRHSGEIKDEQAKDGQDGVRKVNGQKDADGKPMLNSFLFDDELDADLQNSAWGGKYLQMNTDDDKFPILTPARAGGEWPPFAGGQPTVSAAAASVPATPAAGVSPGGRSSALPPPNKSERASPTGAVKINGGVGAGVVDALGDQFSNFSIDTKAFSPSPNVDVPSLSTSFLGGGGSSSYVHDHGAFVYGGPTGGAGGRNEGMGANRFAGLRLEDLQGDMLSLCKDQFGCRYLQKKLEDGNPEHRDMIYNEVFPHFAELMSDPFANYLAQRLLEHATDEQRDALIESISGELVTISLNMHGTRAVQKMIDCLSTRRQVQSLILALNLNVVTLIKDLNGNHVIQKCLNALPPEDNQFIYNAVATHCIEVATHRHGCCVLQRCIDHASESQRIQLVTEITYNSLTLVQDAFGNYVVQYVLDLNDNRFIEAIVRQFLGNVSALSAQKFSSNVVEKCIRVADATGRRAIIDELLVKNRLERLLRDSFANYVVQTALDYAEPAQRAQLVETIRPILPMIRNTPYGKRIQSKIQRETNEHMGHRGGYNHHPGQHHQAFIPAGAFYGVPAFNGPPPHYPPHLAHGMHAPPPHSFGEYARAGSPYYAGYPAMMGSPMVPGPNASLPGGPGAAGQQAGAGFAPYAQAGPGAGDFAAPSSLNAHGGLPSAAGYGTFAM
ncbi:pumilio RNA binding protein [Rhodotorula toruloides]|uniref:Pumilio RNA binding protein n=1 Tax=Rhodotorula toruloides TaxID=5286 RepID=A0A511KJJ5_RHOTO|nr:pumilio RNA binding protein [Rhodotorula toruloides]